MPIDIPFTDVPVFGADTATPPAPVTITETFGQKSPDISTLPLDTFANYWYLLIRPEYVNDTTDGVMYRARGGERITMLSVAAQGNNPGDIWLDVWSSDDQDTDLYYAGGGVTTVVRGDGRHWRDIVVDIPLVKGKYYHLTLRGDRGVSIVHHIHSVNNATLRFSGSSVPPPNLLVWSHGSATQWLPECYATLERIITP